MFAFLSAKYVCVGLVCILVCIVCECVLLKMWSIVIQRVVTEEILYIQHGS